MLSLCTSLVVAGRPSDMVDLAAFSRRLGFGAVINPDAAETLDVWPGPLAFCLIDSRTPLDRTRSVIRALRRATDINLRFAPVIAVGTAVTEAQMHNFASEGFDDILSLPLDIPTAVSRLEAHLTRTASYFETADYLGPDRRRYSPREQTVLGSFVLYNVKRDPHTGVTTTAARIAGKSRYTPPIARIARA